MTKICSVCTTTNDFGIEQQAKYEEWVKDSKNAKKVHMLKSLWFAWKDGSIIAQADTFADINKAVETKGLHAIDTYREHTSLVAVKVYRHPLPTQGNISSISIKCKIDFSNVQGTYHTLIYSIVLIRLACS